MKRKYMPVLQWVQAFPSGVREQQERHQQLRRLSVVGMPSTLLGRNETKSRFCNPCFRFQLWREFWLLRYARNFSANMDSCEIGRKFTLVVLSCVVWGLLCSFPVFSIAVTMGNQTSALRPEDIEELQKKCTCTNFSLTYRSSCLCSHSERN